MLDHIHWKTSAALYNQLTKQHINTFFFTSVHSTITPLQFELYLKLRTIKNSNLKAAGIRRLDGQKAKLKKRKKI